MVEGGVESDVQEKSDGKGNLQELAAIITSSATAAAIAASESQRQARKVSSTSSLCLACHEVLHFQSINTTPTPKVLHCTGWYTEI